MLKSIIVGIIVAFITHLLGITAFSLIWWVFIIFGNLALLYLIQLIKEN